MGGEQAVEATGHSIWLMPEESSADEIRRAIKSLSLKYGAPDFEPHVTLIGNLQGPEDAILHKTERLAEGLEPYQIVFSDFGYLTEYFRSLFAVVERSKEVMHAFNAATQIFGIEKSDYMPHLSLLYGSIPEAEKKAVISSVGNGFYKAFTVNRLFLYSTSGAVEKWHKIGDFEIQ